MKIIWKIMLVILPIVFIIGCLRMELGHKAPNTFALSWEEYLYTFSMLPTNTQQYWNEMVEAFMGSYEQLIHSNQSWFEQAANFFGMIGNAILFFFRLLYIPFYWVITVFTNTFHLIY